jgi:hypothetical protein
MIIRMIKYNQKSSNDALEEVEAFRQIERREDEIT